MHNGQNTVTVQNMIIGQEHITGHFENAIRSDKVSHAYILQGEASSGKKSLALMIAKSLVCEEQSGRPCEQCLSCRLADSRSHPDIRWVTHNKAEIAVDDIREQINNDIGIKPYKSRRKIYIVPDAETMKAPAQNALLKTIEEPPAYAVIILLATNADLFLPTVLSRCVMMHIRPVSQEVIRTLLIDRYGVSNREAADFAAFSDGNPGRAIKLAASEDFSKLKDEVKTALHSVTGKDAETVFDIPQMFAEDKKQASDAIDLIRVWFRDVLVYKACRREDLLAYKEDADAIKRAEKRLCYTGIDEIIKAAGRAQSRLAANVRPETALEVLFMTVQNQVRPQA